MKKLILFGSLLILIACSAHSAETLYVAVDGNDANPGTKEKPLANIQKALDSLTGQERTLILQTGTYYIDQPLRITLDGPPVKLAVRGQADQKPPVISGGKLITGWKEKEKGLAVTEIPEVKNGTWTFRDLYVNDARAVRARHPNTGYFLVEKSGEDRRTSFFYKDGDLRRYQDLENIELAFLHDWSMTRCPVKEIDEQARRLTVTTRIGCSMDFFAIDGWEPHPRYFLENSLEFLDAPGEFFLDTKNGTLYYRLKEGESVETLQAIAPKTSQLLLVSGSDTKATAGERLVFENLQFQHSAGTFPKPENTYWGIQATCHGSPSENGGEKQSTDPAALQFENVSRAVFKNCRFSHLGESGLWFAKNCFHCGVSRCLFEDIGGNGIMIGTHDGENTATDCTVEHCEVKEIGKTLFGAVGIWIGLSSGNRIVNNHVWSTPYSGISCGWRWSPEPTVAKNNRIEWNHIHHNMQILSDGGGIYTLGFQPDSSLSFNRIHDIPTCSGRAESNGMFIDEGSSGFMIEGNVIYDTEQSSLRFHQAYKNIVKDNVLSTPEGVPMIRYNSTPEERIELKNNTTPRSGSDELKDAIEQWDTSAKKK